MVLAVGAAVDAAPNTDIICIQLWKHCGDHEHRKLHAVRMLILCQQEIETVLKSLLHFRNTVQELVDIVPAMTFPYRFTVFWRERLCLSDVLIDRKSVV